LISSQMLNLFLFSGSWMKVGGRLLLPFSTVEQNGERGTA
jgi:hypothetical protein